MMAIMAADPELRSAKTPSELIKYLKPQIVNLEYRLDEVYAAIDGWK
jgi:hypothetical protein